MLRNTVNTGRAELATSTRAMSSEARSRTRGRQPVLYVIYLSVLRHLLHLRCFPAHYPCRITTTTTSAPKLAGQYAGTAEPQVPDRNTFNAQQESASAQITQCGIWTEQPQFPFSSSAIEPASVVCASRCKEQVLGGKFSMQRTRLLCTDKSTSSANFSKSVRAASRKISWSLKRRGRADTSLRGINGTRTDVQFS
jgi:hypothetical protein